MWELIEELVGYLGWTSLILSVVCVFMGAACIWYIWRSIGSCTIEYGI